MITYITVLLEFDFFCFHLSLICLYFIFNQSMTTKIFADIFQSLQTII